MAKDRRVRIGDWLVPYDDATQEITLQRTMRDVLQATPGDHTKCMNTRCIEAHKRDGLFPHPVYLVSTIKTRVYVVDELDDYAEPAHAVRYELSERDSKLIGEHDKYGVGVPGTLTLRVPTDPKGSPKRAARDGGKGRFADGAGHGSNAGGQYSGKSRRPITSIGAAARFKVAVGALTELT